MRTILVTGTAGFIGFHTAAALISSGWRVVGLDDINDYYDVRLKRDRLAQLEGDGFHFEQLDLADRGAVAELFARHRFERVIHLAAQAGVRYSLENPHAYIDANLVGTTNILEGCRHHGCGHLIYASSSSVYGANTQQPFSVHQNVDHPLSLYAATKKACELLAHTYSHLFRLPTTGLRFFTVYGPWGRPDMALFKFTKGIIEGTPIDVYNHGRMKRDFTYVDDVVEAIVRLVDLIPQANPDWNAASPDPATSAAPYRIYNIGNHSPVQLEDFIAAIERAVGKKAIRNLLPMQPGDVPATYADVTDLSDAVGFAPSTSIDEGVARFVDWYRSYYQV